MIEEVEREATKEELRNSERLQAAFKWCEDNQERINAKPYAWYGNNRENVNKYRREYRKRTPKNLLTERIRHLINYSLRRKGIERVNKCWGLLGYSVEELKERLNKTMPKGYNWQDFLEGKLDIDHIKCIKDFNYNNINDKGFKECWDINNLRLLTVYDNRSKRFNRCKGGVLNANR